MPLHKVGNLGTLFHNGRRLLRGRCCNLRSCAASFRLGLSFCRRGWRFRRWPITRWFIVRRPIGFCHRFVLGQFLRRLRLPGSEQVVLVLGPIIAALADHAGMLPPIPGNAHVEAVVGRETVYAAAGFLPNAARHPQGPALSLRQV